MKAGYNEGYTKKHRVDILIWYEEHQSIELAIWREKYLKKWKRQRKINLIEEHNLYREDLSKDWY